MLSTLARAGPAVPLAAARSTITTSTTTTTRALLNKSMRKSSSLVQQSPFSSLSRTSRPFKRSQWHRIGAVRNASTAKVGEIPNAKAAAGDAARELRKDRGRLKRYAMNMLAFSGAFALTATGLVIAFFVYDFTTYRTDVSEQDVYVPEAALRPRRGGPKNLPIADMLIDDGDGEQMIAQHGKPRLVILGSGWGSVAMLKTLDPGAYHVTLVSPNNYFLFTPLLPSAASGTLALKSLVEPVRVILDRIKGHYIQAKAVDIDMDEKLIEMVQTGADGKERNFYVPYDKLVIGVGEFSENMLCTYIPLKRSV